MPTALVISPHADDAAFFCGGTLAKRHAEGWETILVHVTDDCKDGMRGSRAEVQAQNHAQLRDAAQHLGITTIEDLGFETDCLCDSDRIALRERFVYLYRKYRPLAVFTFDPFARYEENQDHVVCARAAQEAFWVACFHLHHPEHLEAGLAPFSVGERWYFSRQQEDANHAEVISPYLQSKIDAVCAHGTMVRHILHQMRLQLETLGRRSEIVNDAIENDPRPLITGWVTASTCDDEGRHVERFRVERLGALEEFLMSISAAVEGA
ncbi:MAG: PIG-L family deacetylase [Candidatus Hydrogenedentes bacterium]|nr:PIG-L family deacetylase [Candidatus Hydrogenedentota bacterium]